MNEKETIRKALEPHYVGRYEGDHMICRKNNDNKLIYFHDSTSALCHFLNDASMTGARIKDLFDRLVGLEEFCYACDTHDPDGNIAALWLETHGLEDPRN